MSFTTPHSSSPPSQGKIMQAGLLLHQSWAQPTASSTPCTHLWQRMAIGCCCDTQCLYRAVREAAQDGSTGHRKTRARTPQPQPICSQLTLTWADVWPQHKAVLICLHHAAPQPSSPSLANTTFPTYPKPTFPSFSKLPHIL